MTRSACLNAIYELAKIDERVVFIGSDLAPNTLPDFKRDFPDRYFMEGIQEQNIIGMAAGLAMEGFIPYVNTIATFVTRRCYEQVVLDVALHNLPVRLIGNGGGLVYAPLGPTHMAIDDIAIMRAIPNMSVVVCSDNEEMKAFMATTIANPSPIYIRLGKDSDPLLSKQPFNCNSIPEILLIGTGTMTAKLAKVSKLLDIPNTLMHISQIKPLKAFEVAPSVNLIVTAEEGIGSGGLGTAVAEKASVPVLRLGIPDAFAHHYGEQDDLLETYGLTPEKMTAKIREFYDAL